MNEQEIFLLFKDFLAFINDKQKKQRSQNNDNYISVNDYIFNNPNKHLFFSYFNEIKSVNMTHFYLYPKNRGKCWNCHKAYDHTCCEACKQEVKNCTCAFICGLTCPTGQKNSNGEYTQFEKCKWYTSGNDFEHQCKGIIKSDEEIILYTNERDHQKFNIREKIERKKVCYRCGADDHVVYNCKQEKRCYKCNRNNHLAKDCYIYYY